MSKKLNIKDMELLDEFKQLQIRGGKGGGGKDDPADPTGKVNTKDCPIYAYCKTICST